MSRVLARTSASSPLRRSAFVRSTIAEATPLSEGPGAGIKHVFESTDGGASWNDISANMPDVPVNDVVVLASGSIVAATDLGVIARSKGATQWKRVGAGLPVTTVMDLTTGPDGQLYAATHGRGIWRIPIAGL